ncbi:MAG: ATP-binding cassette domain-containing protein [Planctomycetes bacterium]|nr:ATP-binding cassette domain-containing protein [Planctomycetota bacterium]
MTLHIPKGQTTVIIGRSGVGKSVTLKHIVGLLRPDSGKVILDGQDLTSLRPRELKEVRRKCGLLFQSGALINWLTVAENVALPLIEHDHMPKARVEAIVREKLALVDMLHALEKYPSEISGGMKKRAGLARAIVRNPEVILYDEPTSGLDPVMSNQINELVLDMQSKLKVTQLVVTHDMSSAYMIADKIAMVYRGQIIAEGTPEEIRGGADPVVRQFIEGLTSGPLTDQMRSEEGAFPARPPTSSPRIP